MEQSPARKPMGFSTRHLAQYFRWKHLPPHLQEVSKTFAQQAIVVIQGPETPESTVALRKLLEAKDAAVRNALPPFAGTDEELLADLKG